MKIQIGIAENHRKAVADELIKILADENVLLMKTKNAHWNIERSDFNDKYNFFKNQSKQLDKIINSIAKRIRSIGHVVPATLQTYLSLTHLTERKSEENSSQVLITELLEDHESLMIILNGNIMSFANDFHDMATSFFLTHLLEKQQNMSWLLRSNLIQ